MRDPLLQKVGHMPQVDSSSFGFGNDDEPTV
jgi:hypothetical protein